MDKRQMAGLINVCFFAAAFFGLIAVIIVQNIR